MGKSITKITLAATVFAVFAAVASAQDAPPTEKEIRELIYQLGDEEYHKREAAQQRLLEIGEPAEQFLREALSNDDPEIRERAQVILDKIKWYVDSALRAVLDKETVARLEAFEVKSPQERRRLLERAIAVGKEKALKFCLKVLLHESDKSLLMVAERAVYRFAGTKDIEAVERVLKVRSRFGLIKCLGLLCLEAGDVERAIKYLEQARKMQKNDYGVNRALALLYEKSGDWKKSAEFYEELLKIEPAGILYLQHYGEALWNLGKTAEALAAWALIVERNPNRETAYLLLGDIYAAHGKIELAGKTLMAGLARFEEYRFPVRFAEILAAGGKKAEALVQLRLARGYAWREYEFALIDAIVFCLYPAEADLEKLRAQAVRDAQAFEKARDNESAIRRYHFAAAIARKLLRNDDLLQHLERVEALLTPRMLFEFDGMRPEMVALYMDAKRWDKAIGLCEKILKDGWDSEINDLLGECWWRKGDKKKALAIWRRFVSVERYGIKRLDLYAMALYRHGMYEELVAAVEKHDDIVSLPVVLYLKGCAQLKLDRTKDALESFRSLMRRYNNQAIAEMIARALREAGKLDEARKFFAEAGEGKLKELVAVLMKKAATAEERGSVAFAKEQYKLVIELAPKSESAAKARERLKIIEAKGK